MLEELTDENLKAIVDDLQTIRSDSEFRDYMKVFDGRQLLKIQNYYMKKGKMGWVRKFAEIARERNKLKKGMLAE